MPIRQFRNKVNRYRFGLAGLRLNRGPRRQRRGLSRLAKYEAEKRAKSMLSAEAAARAKASRDTKRMTKRLGLSDLAGRAVSFLRKSFGRIGS